MLPLFNPLFNPRATPYDVQTLLRKLKYHDCNAENYTCRNPVTVLKKKEAHCLEGSLLAAAILSQRYDVRLVNLRASDDEDHVLAVFKQDGWYGALSRSSCDMLEWREPVHSTLDSLVRSYRPFYKDLQGNHSLIGYSGLLRPRLIPTGWVDRTPDLGFVGDMLDALPHTFF